MSGSMAVFDAGLISSLKARQYNELDAVQKKYIRETNNGLELGKGDVRAVNLNRRATAVCRLDVVRVVQDLVLQRASIYDPKPKA